MEMPKIPTLAELEAQERILSEREKQRKAENHALCVKHLPAIVQEVVNKINYIKSGGSVEPIYEAKLYNLPLNTTTVVNLLNEEFKRQGVDSFLVAKVNTCPRSGVDSVSVGRRR